MSSIQSRPHPPGTCISFNTDIEDATEQQSYRMIKYQKMVEIQAYVPIFATQPAPMLFASGPLGCSLRLLSVHYTHEASRGQIHTMRRVVLAARQPLLQPPRLRQRLQLHTYTMNSARNTISTWCSAARRLLSGSSSGGGKLPSRSSIAEVRNLISVVITCIMISTLLT